MPTSRYTSVQEGEEVQPVMFEASPIPTSDDDADGDHAFPTNSSSKKTTSLTIAFWLLGLFNNSSYVIMIASAKTISEGGTAMVFLANIFPSMLVKLTAPYWFDCVSYGARMLTAFSFMVCSFAMVASSHTTGWQLLGVALGSAQSGLGEASLLAAAGKCDTTGQGACISGFSSGTGLAGVFGFLWKFIWNEWMKFSMATTLWLAQSLALLYIGIFWRYLHPHLLEATTLTAYHPTATVPSEEQPLELTTYHDHHHKQENTVSTINNSSSDSLDNTNSNGAYRDEEDSTLEANDRPQNSMSNDFHNPPTLSTIITHDDAEDPVHEMSILQRANFVIDLWPYIVPLFVVYAAEYSLQAGTWTAIGFPVDDQKARDEFYEYSNWMYQAGVFVSRSSGSFGTAPMAILWLMPALQAVNVVFFAMVAAQHVWYNYTLLIPCFYVGLLGGGVYVHGYKRICADFDIVDRREFALAATSVAESLGIVCADILGLFIQACLYRTNDIPGAIASCPIPGVSPSRQIP